jgi:hypothetical protein
MRPVWKCMLLFHLPSDKTYHFNGQLICNNCEKVVGWWR